LICLGPCLATPVWGQLNERVLHSFSDGADGQQPYARLVQGKNGALYGTTFLGGTNKGGVIFKVKPDGSGNAPILSFDSDSTNPGGVANPSGLVEGSDGTLYGTTGFGGSSRGGTVFKVNPDGSGYVVLHSFSSALSGPYEPAAALALGSDGNLYGTTQFGGLAGYGSVFKLSTNGSEYSTLHHFGFGNDGRNPQSSLIQGLDGALYGTSALGGASAQGGASGFGTVFRLNADGTGETVLHSFMPSGGDGQCPYTSGLVQGTDGALYGTTQQGGSTAEGGSSGYGTVFKLNPDGKGFILLHNFSASAGDGKYPNSALVQGTDGALYGTTEYGGNDNVGVVFRLNTNGQDYAVLYHFGSNAADGRYPGASLVQASDGGLFGTTKFGGAHNLGTVFRLAPAPPIISAITQLPDKTIRLSIKAAPNFMYRVEGSPDRLHWAPLSDVTNTTGTVEFLDSDTATASTRFYRATWVP
jgi:uncharacterized repeat protein (TIGR03803 family)